LAAGVTDQLWSVEELIREAQMKLMLSRALAKEVAEWRQKQYAELAALDYPIAYERRINGKPTRYQVEVELLEKNERYIQIMVSMDDGGISAFCPPSYCLEIRAPDTDPSS
jgi:hypothetical protein